MRAFLGTHLPKLVFVLAVLPGLALTILMHTAAERRLTAEFDRAAAMSTNEPERETLREKAFQAKSRFH